MPKFIVRKKEIWEQFVIIEAKDTQEAVDKVARGEGEMREESFEYCDDMNKESWSAEEVPNG
jgi:hypothetical protein